MCKKVRMTNANLFHLQENHVQLMESHVSHYQYAQAMLKLDASMELMESAYLHYQLELLKVLKSAD